jgi:SP family general alpha glucoside:H+ symporter-like MFS transporter
MAWGFGRRTLFLAGLCGLCVTLVVMGFLRLVPGDAGSLATGALMLVWAAFYQVGTRAIAYKPPLTHSGLCRNSCLLPCR